MNLSWEWKLFLINTLCQSLFLLYTFLSLLLGFHVTLPDVYKADADRLFNRKLLAIIIFVNVVGNYACIKLKSRLSVLCRSKSNPNTFVKDYGSGNNWNHNGFHPKRLLSNNSKNNGFCDPDSLSFEGRVRGTTNQRNATPGLSLAGWDECRDCNELAPPRSKHCPLCRSCILKRDHHCFFAGCCIGFHNQRFFTIFCLNGAFGASYSAYATFTFIQENYKLFADWGLISYFPPVFLCSWLLGYTSGGSVLFVLFQYWSLFTSTLCFYFFLFQMFLIIRGQTKYEFKKRVFPYRSDLISNVKSVFGPSRIFCLIGFLVPLPFVGYFGDGKTWDELSHAIKVC